MNDIRLEFNHDALSLEPVQQRAEQTERRSSYGVSTLRNENGSRSLPELRLSHPPDQACKNVQTHPEAMTKDGYAFGMADS